MTSMREGLQQRFERQRIVLWQDTEGEYTQEIENFDLPDVTVLRVANNEYGLKHQILRERRKQRFLLYRTGPVPPDVDNWLLDLEVAYGVFTADRVALLQDELGLTTDGTAEVIGTHLRFFDAKSRTKALSTLLSPTDDATVLQAKMSAVTLGQRGHSLTEILQTLLVEHSTGKDARLRSLGRYGLLSFFWSGMASIYHYDSPDPSMTDLVLWIFDQATQGFPDQERTEADGQRTPVSLRQIQIDYERFQHDPRSAEAMRVLAASAWDSLGDQAALTDLTLTELTRRTTFEAEEQEVLRHLAFRVHERTITDQDLTAIAHERRTSPWYPAYQVLYKAVQAAGRLLTAVEWLDVSATTLEEGVQRYTQDWYRVDQDYRLYRHAYRTASQPEVLDTLTADVERAYTGTYLRALGSTWQSLITPDSWRSETARPQASFYQGQVVPQTHLGKHVVVIVSDALRYEVGDSLVSALSQDTRYTPRLEPLLTALPSYTQLGMAALLPHRRIAHSPTGDPVLVDGHRTDGTANRDKILRDVGGTAIQAEQLLDMTSGERADLITSHTVVYAYHNQIDAIGDDATTERQVPEAAHEAVTKLTTLVKKVAPHADKVLITSDHGFLYQDSPPDGVTVLFTQPSGREILTRNRRYVLGRGLSPDAAFHTFSPSQLGLDGDVEVQVPRSVHRIKLPGAGNRYVHGGAMPQEVVVPLITIDKRGARKAEPVKVQIRPETDRITTGQLTVAVYQVEPVTDKVLPRVLRASLYAGEDVLISNQPVLHLESASDEPRDRLQHVTLLLSKEADGYNHGNVTLRLEEQVRGTRWKTVSSAPYRLQRAFTTDFDF